MHGADSGLWSRPNKHLWTHRYITEGYRPGNLKLVPLPIAAIELVMTEKGISTEDVRPRHIGTYGKACLAGKAPRSRVPAGCEASRAGAGRLRERRREECVATADVLTVPPDLQ